MSETIIQEALQAEQRFMQNPDLVTAYDQAEKARLDRIAREEYLLDQGRKEGMDEGRKAGLDEGRKEGHRDIAFTLLRMNKPIDEIAAITGLSEAEIQSLKNAQ